MAVRYTVKTHTSGWSGGVSRTDDGRLDVNFSAPGGLDREVAQAIVDATHRETCAYSHA